MRALVLVLVLAFAALVLAGGSGCYSPDVPNGGLVCATAGKSCPSGFHCARNNSCWRNGQDPPGNFSGVVSVVNGGGGVLSGGSRQGRVSVGQPIVGTAASDRRSARLGVLSAAGAK
jgi:hypothetical protein